MGWHGTHCPPASLPGSQLQGGSGSAPTAGHPAFLSHEMNPSQSFISRLAVPVGASVVGERVPQEDEDEDDAGGRQGRAGDVEQPSSLGVLHCPVQVVEKFLVPNLKPEGGGETGSRRRGWTQAGARREGMRAEGP